jgi:hypothetical protein
MAEEIEQRLLCVNTLDRCCVLTTLSIAIST